MEYDNLQEAQFSTHCREVRVLVADTQTLFCVAMTQWLAERGCGISATWAAGAAAVLRKVATQQPDVVLLGTSFEGQDVARMVARIQEASEPPPRIILLDDRLRLENLRAAVAAKASGYWTKRRTPREIRDAVITVFHGRHTFCPQSRRRIVIRAGRARYRDALEQSQFRFLTLREFQVAVMLAKGFTIEQCAQHLGIAVATVDHFKWRLMKKLGLRRTVDLTLLAQQEGLLE